MARAILVKMVAKGGRLRLETTERHVGELERLQMQNSDETAGWFGKCC
jgi:hypothetical protein